MSLRARIEAKERRTAAFPLQVGDVAAAAAAVQTHRAALDAHLAVLRQRTEAGTPAGEADHERTEQLRQQLADAKARQTDTVVLIELQALEPDVWDAVFGDAPQDDDGDVDLDDVRGALLAASCVDPELRDEAWWETQLARPEYSKGDKLAINHTLITLNLNTPDGRQGNG